MFTCEKTAPPVYSASGVYLPLLMIRILYLIDTFFGPVGGTENQILRIVQGVDPQRFHFDLVTLQESRWLESADLPCRVHSLGIRSFRSLDFFRGQREFIAYCRDRDIDIVQTFFRDSSIVGMLWGRKAGVRTLIASRRNLGAGYWHNWMQIRMLRHLAKHTHHYVANSQAAAEEAIHVEKVPRNKVSVIPNCLDTTAFKAVDPSSRQQVRLGWGVPSDALVVGSVANLRPIKNLDFLVRAARLVVDRVPEAHFVVLGNGPLRGELEREVRTQGLQKHFFLPGASTHVARDLQAFDATVLCSKGESSPNAVLEYMAAGKASVVADVGGCGELIDDGVCGYTYPPGNHERFAELLAELLRDAGKRQAMGDRAQKRARDRHDIGTVIPQLESFYTSIADSGHSRGP